MNKCTNTKVGKLITRYEFNLLSEDEQKLFEAHLLECNSCSEELYSMLPIVGSLKENPQIIINALRENIKKLEEKSLPGKLKIFFSDSINSLTSAIESLFLEHRLAAISAVTFCALLFFSIIVWKADLFNKQITQTTPELAQHKVETIDSAGALKSEDSSKNIPQKYPHQEKAAPQIQTEIDLASLAEIEYEPYSALLSTKEETESQPADRLFNDGIKYYEAKDYRQAIITFSQLYESDSHYTEAQFYAGICYLLLKDFNRGIRYLQNAARSNNNTMKEKSHWYLGNTYLIKSDREKALEEFQIVVQLNGEHKSKAQELIKSISKQ
jgi:tetratricopeptide (TPR) repeat protein